jgi:hypothetical protein
MIQKLILVVTAIAALGAATGTTAGEGYWSRAGREIGEAASAVGDATVDTSKDAWSATKRGSGEAWDKTKEVSGEAWDKTKEVSGDAWDATKEAAHDGAEYVEEKTSDD